MHDCTEFTGAKARSSLALDDVELVEQEPLARKQPVEPRVLSRTVVVGG